MLTRGKSGAIRTYGFLISLEIQDGETTPEKAANLLADSLTFHEGIGQVDIEQLGEIDIYGEEPQDKG